MVKVKITDKQGLVQESGGGTDIGNKVVINSAGELETKGHVTVNGTLTHGSTTQTLSNTSNNQILSCALTPLLLVDAGGGARTKVLLGTGSFDGQICHIANISDANSEKITLGTFTASSQLSTVFGSGYEIIPLQAGGHIFGPLLWYKNGWFPVSGTTIRIAGIGQI